MQKNGVCCGQNGEIESGKKTGAGHRHEDRGNHEESRGFDGRGSELRKVKKPRNLMVPFCEGKGRSDGHESAGQTEKAFPSFVKSGTLRCRMVVIAC